MVMPRPVLSDDIGKSAMDPLSSIPSINGGDAGPSSADAMFGGVNYNTPYSSPFIFGGSGKGVNQSSASWPALVGFALVLTVGAVVAVSLIRAFVK